MDETGPCGLAAIGEDSHGYMFAVWRVSGSGGVVKDEKGGEAVDDGEGDGEVGWRVTMFFEEIIADPHDEKGRGANEEEEGGSGGVFLHLHNFGEEEGV